MLLLAASQFDIDTLQQSMAQISLGLIIILLVLQIITQLLLNLQWVRIAQLANTPIPFMKMLYINAQGSVIESITPGAKIGGEVTRAILISRMSGCSGEEAASVVALQKLFSLSAFFLINMFAVGYLIGQVPLFNTSYIQFSIYGILGALLFLFACIFIAPNQISNYLLQKRESRFTWIIKLRSFMLTLLTHLQLIRKKRGEWILQFVLSVLIWVLFPIKMFLLTLPFFPDGHIIYISAITFVSYMVAMLPIFPGGLGGFEGTMSGLLLIMGMSLSDAAVIAVIFRFVTFWFVIVISLAFAGIYRAISHQSKSAT